MEDVAALASNISTREETELAGEGERKEGDRRFRGVKYTELLEAECAIGGGVGDDMAWATAAANYSDANDNFSGQLCRPRADMRLPPAPLRPAGLASSGCVQRCRAVRSEVAGGVIAL